MIQNLERILQPPRAQVRLMPAAPTPFTGTAGMAGSFSAALAAAMPRHVGVQGGQNGNASLGPRLSADPDASGTQRVELLGLAEVLRHPLGRIDQRGTRRG